MNEKSIFIKFEHTLDIGNIILGKYIFWTRFLFAITDTVLLFNEADRNIHGTNATNKNIE
jgi:hypothetical protein